MIVGKFGDDEELFFEIELIAESGYVLRYFDFGEWLKRAIANSKKLALCEKLLVR
ncbi:MAG: hypothetical protein U7127_01390 [Phormidium sp.]